LHSELFFISLIIQEFSSRWELLRITIEHILPQKANNIYWEERFNPKDHAKWLHKLGNLTLISGSKNSEAQNTDFLKKKKIYEKLNNKTSFDITKDLCNIED